MLPRSGLMNYKPHLEYPRLQGLTRAVNLPEFMRSIGEGVRIYRPYPDWAKAIEAHPELARLQPTKFQDMIVSCNAGD